MTTAADRARTADEKPDRGPVRRRSGLVLALIALVGLVIALYLTATKLAGGVPICGPGGGCETVETSEYSSVAGIPVALFGVLYSLLVGGAALRWWSRGDRRALYAAYALGLIGTLIECYLVYLELFVIHAICIWCAGFGVTVVVGCVGAIVTVARANDGPATVAVPESQRVRS